MKTVKVVDVADWFIARANRERSEEDGEGITNLKLQKVLYFAQAAHLAVESKPLFSEEIYAWNYGPVIPDVYHLFKTYNKTAIVRTKGQHYQKIEKSTSDFLEEVWQLFGKYSAAKLVQMTHSHAPWKDAYDGSPNRVIDKAKIQEYYKDVFIRT